MEFLPKFSGADCDCIQTCRRLLDFCVNLCYYEYRNAPVRSRNPTAGLCSRPSVRCGNERTRAARKSPPGRSAMHRSVRRASFPDDPYTSGDGTAVHPAAGERPESKKAFPASARRISCRMQQRLQHTKRKHMHARMELAHSDSGGLSKTHRLRLSAASGPRQAQRARPFRCAGAAARRMQIHPCTAFAVRLFRGELLSVRKTAFRKRSPHRSGCLPPIRRPCPFAETGSSAVPRCAVQTAGAAAPLNYTRFRRYSQEYVEEDAQKDYFVLSFT